MKRPLLDIYIFRELKIVLSLSIINGLLKFSRSHPYLDTREIGKFDQ